VSRESTLREVNSRKYRRCDLEPADWSHALERIACCKATNSQKVAERAFDGSGNLCLVTFDEVALAAAAAQRSTRSTDDR
jgi:hypothetical protein